jgi:hypothetical protein
MAGLGLLGSCLFVASSAVAAPGPYYPVYTNPQPAASSAPAVPAPAAAYPAPVYYDPYYVPPYYGPIESRPVYTGPYDPAIAPWKFNFDFGGGPTAVSGSQGHLRSGDNFVVGGGYNFNKNLGVVLEFMQSDLRLTRDALNQNGADDGSVWLWSMTLNPIWRYKISGIVGGYIIGGGGFYERDQRFVQNQFAFDRFGNLYGFRVQDRQTDDTGGLNIGAGFTFNCGWGTKFFVEARYHYLFTSGYPTEIIPVTFGFRW